MSYDWADSAQLNSCLVQPTSLLEVHHKTINALTTICIAVQTEGWVKTGCRRSHSSMPFAKTREGGFCLKSFQQPEVTRATEGGGERCKQMAADHIISVSFWWQRSSRQSHVHLQKCILSCFLCLKTDLEQASSKLLCLSRCVNGQHWGLLLPCSWLAVKYVALHSQRKRSAEWKESEWRSKQKRIKMSQVRVKLSKTSGRGNSLAPPYRNVLRGGACSAHFHSSRAPEALRVTWAVPC